MKKIIFEFDGVVADSIPSLHQAISKAFDKHSVSLRKMEIGDELTFSADRAEAVKRIADKYADGAYADDVTAFANECCRTAYASEIELKEYVASSLKKLKKSGYSMNVLTSSPRCDVEACLCHTRIDGFFDNIIYCDELGIRKNDASTFAAVAERLGVSPEDCIFVDANVSALKAAKQAGMKIVGVFDDCSSRWQNKAAKEFCNGYIYNMPELLPIVAEKTYETVSEYIEDNWDNVIRVRRKDGDNYVGLPYPFTVPAVGHFETLYYWDTHFTNVGLLIDGRAELAKNNTDNIIYLVDKIGFMPNSNGFYHLDHSQPPFLSVMVKDVYAYYGDKIWLGSAYNVLCKEYGFWMTKRSTPIGLNRYDTNITDREYLASRAPDYEERVHRDLSAYDRADIGRHYLGTCESGHDCTSRFKFEIFNCAPVELNSLMYAFEKNMAFFAAELGKGGDEEKLWSDRAETRKELMKKYMLDENGCFMDYNFVTGRLDSDFSSASLFPMYAGLADEKNAADFMKQFHRLEADYGVLANEKNNVAGTFQWGYPNGWSPDQMVAIDALDNYGYKEDAARIAQKYIALLDRDFANTHKIWEKYNVVEGSSNAEDEAHGGMPPMMGWTASAYLYARHYLKKEGKL